MTTVVANYNINITEEAANMAAKGFQQAEVEAVLKVAGDDAIWKAMEESKDMDMCDEDFFANAVGDSQNAKFIGLSRIPKPKPVDKTSQNVIKIAKFAVEKYNEIAGTKLVFIGLVAVVSLKFVAGTVYKLIIVTQDCRGTYWDRAVVLDAMCGMKLLSYCHIKKP